MSSANNSNNQKNAAALKLGNELIEKGEFKRALENIQLFINENLNNSEAYFLKASALTSLNKHEEALEAYNSALKTNQKSVEIIYNKGNCLKRLDRIDDAIKCYDQVLFYTNNLHYLAANNRGLCFIILQKFEDAKNSFLDAGKADPKNSGAYYNLGICLHSMKDYGEALSYYDKAIELNSSYSDAYFNKGNTFEALKDYDNAIKCFDLAIKYNSNMIDAYFNKALVLSKKLDFKNAIVNYDKTILLNPKNDFAYYKKAICHQELKQFKEAIGSLSHAVTLAPENPSYFSERANAYLELKEVLNGFNDLNIARKYLLDKNKTKTIEKETLKKTEKNVKEKIKKINIINLLDLISEKLEYMEGNREIRNEFIKHVEPEIKSNILKKFETTSSTTIISDEAKISNLEKFNLINNNGDKNTATSTNNKAPQDKKNLSSNTNLILLNVQENSVNKNDEINKDNSNTKAIPKRKKTEDKDKALNQVQTLINKQKITQENISNIQNIIINNISNTSDIPPSEDQMKQIYDILFSLNQKVQKHESKISKLFKKVEQIEVDLENKLTNYRKLLVKDLDEALKKNLLSSETKANLLEYFNGFNCCFNRFYLTSQMIVQDQFKLNDSAFICIINFLVTLAPFVGGVVACIGKSIGNYLKNLQIKNKAKKFLGLAYDCIDLSQKIGKTSVDICKSENKQGLIMRARKENIENLIKENYTFVQNLALKFENKINFALFNPPEKNPFYKYGEFDANKLIGKFLRDEFDLDEEYDHQFTKFIIEQAQYDDKITRQNLDNIQSQASCGCKSGICLVF